MPPHVVGVTGVAVTTISISTKTGVSKMFHFSKIGPGYAPGPCADFRLIFVGIGRNRAELWPKYRKSTFLLCEPHLENSAKIRAVKKFRK